MATVFTKVGMNWVADKLRESGIAGSGVLPNKIGWGTGAGTADDDDTTLFTEASEARATATLSNVTTTNTGDTFQAVGTLTCAGSGKTITNAGLFDASSGGDMLIKGDHAGVPLLVGDSIEYTFKLQIT